MKTSIPLAYAFLAIASVGGSAQPAQAQLQSRPVPNDGVESFTFQSPSMGFRYSINVGFPQGYKAGDGKKYPALIVTDGDSTFANVHQSAKTLGGAIRPLFIISIGTSLDEGEALHTSRRIYEFSPPGWDRKDAFGKRVEGFCKTFKSPEGRCTGGAAKFLKAISAEMIPVLAEKYPIDTTQLGLFGLSAGGFFTSWAIFQPETPFTKYIISSPAMAYGNGEIFRQEAAYAKDHKDLPVGVYLASGVLEASDPMLEGMGEIVSGMTHLAGTLASRNYPGLKMVIEYHPGMGHMDVMGTSVVRGLRSLYAK
ncbi:alpha/beta hydrolase [Sphingosinicella rhizophila]|uniref:Alpha/beta hydrolase-fold protein n=1 Tax=Sphingosinicella rhizophila TaxID=3050082 RepID=A0ABU3Q5L5_9SPHN|nr:alpha/beta hydrolase-fold protein [Sphingosinicella sp. GR2756]MDT9598691.1 alpha/beta hydrolase-fold protein [Sphingosinicella sp. GR2756]